MSIEFRDGNIFDYDYKQNRLVLVCPVNCRPGVMGAGLAREFTRRWPDLLKDHEFSCRTGVLRPGVVRLLYPEKGRPFVLFFPTKDDWRLPSRLEWIEAGLDDLAGMIETRRGLDQWPWDKPMTWIFPAIGTGLGGLRWDAVRLLIEATASRVPDHRWIVYGSRSG